MMQLWLFLLLALLLGATDTNLHLRTQQRRLVGSFGRGGKICLFPNDGIVIVVVIIGGDRRKAIHVFAFGTGLSKQGTDASCQPGHLFGRGHDLIVANTVGGTRGHDKEGGMLSLNGGSWSPPRQLPLFLCPHHRPCFGSSGRTNGNFKNCRCCHQARCQVLEPEMPI